MPAPTPLPPSLSGRALHVSVARALGVSRRRLRASDLRAPHHQVRVPAALPGTLQLACACALLLLPAGAAFSGATAVRLLDLPTPWRRRAELPPDEVEVAVPRGAARPRVRDVAVRPDGLRPDALVVRRGGLPVLHPVEAWAQRCADLRLEDAVALGDAVRRVAAAAQLQAAVDRLPGRERRRQAQRVLALVRHRVDSPLETRLRLLLLAAGVPEPCCGAAVPRGDHPVAWPDLSWPSVRVAVEVDGSHHRDQRQWQKDLGRRRALEALGWHLVVVSGEDLLVRPAATVALIEQALRARGLRW